MKYENGPPGGCVACHGFIHRQSRKPGEPFKQAQNRVLHGQAIMELAKTTEDWEQVINEFKQAAKLAPD